MPATRVLPPSHTVSRTVDLAADRALAIGLNLAALVLFFGVGWLCLRLTLVLRPGAPGSLGGSLNLVFLLGLLCSGILGMLAHEMIHGIFFWVFTRERPSFGLTLLYAFAAAPGWYLPRNLYWVVCLSPLVGLTLLGTALLGLLPLPLLPYALFAMTLNAAGSLGDVYTALLLLRQPAQALVCDSGSSFTIYCTPEQG
jgi:hypothetical protein